MPEMRLRAAAVVPPTRTFVPVEKIPSPRLPRATVPVLSVPMKFPSITVFAAGARISMLRPPLLPPMTFRSAGPSPPMVTFDSVTYTPSPPLVPLLAAAVPLMSVPMKSPVMALPPVPIRAIPCAAKWLTARPLTVLLPPVSTSPLAFGARLPSRSMASTALLPSPGPFVLALAPGWL